jgi:hypothetical protein
MVLPAGGPLDAIVRHLGVDVDGAVIHPCWCIDKEILMVILAKIVDRVALVQLELGIIAYGFHVLGGNVLDNVGIPGLQLKHALCGFGAHAVPPEAPAQRRFHPDLLWKRD